MIGRITVKVLPAPSIPSQSAPIWFTRHFKGHTSAVYCVAFSPDGRTALTGDFNGGLILWDVEIGQIIRRLSGHKGIVVHVMYRRDGQSALSDGISGTMLWDLSSGTVIRHFDGGAAFSPDERLIFGDGAIYPVLWDVTTATIIREYTLHLDHIGAVAFTHDGRNVRVSDLNGAVELWRIDSQDELIAWTQANRYIPELACDQQQLYRLTSTCDTSDTSSTNTANPAAPTSAKDIFSYPLFYVASFS